MSKKTTPWKPPRVRPMKRGPLTGETAEPLEVRAHHLVCAVCARGGARNPPPGRKVIGRLLAALWEYPFAPIRVMADTDVGRAHYLDVYEDRDSGRLPAGFRRREADYAGRFKDMEVCRLLGIYPNTVLPAYHIYMTLFERKPTLDGLCRGDGSEVWPECPYARSRCYEKIAGANLPGGLEQQTLLGERLAGKGIFAMLRPRTRAEMARAKAVSAGRIARKADRLYIRPNHLLCILCNSDRQEPLIEDNLIELRKRMEENPDIPVTLVEGCCMVCDPCNVYHPAEHVCYHASPKNYLRDLLILRKLGLRPGSTLPAREVYRLVYERIPSLKEVCGWGDCLNTARFWAPCGGYTVNKAYEKARAKGLIARPKHGMARPSRPRPHRAAPR